MSPRRTALGAAAALLVVCCSAVAVVAAVSAMPAAETPPSETVIASVGTLPTPAVSPTVNNSTANSTGPVAPGEPSAEATSDPVSARVEEPGPVTDQPRPNQPSDDGGLGGSDD